MSLTMKPFDLINFTRFAPHLLAAALCVTGANAETRTWTNLEGRTIEAEIVDTDGESVTIKMDNGLTHALLLSTLSPADVEYSQQWQAEMEALANAPKPTTEPLMATPGTLIYASELNEIDDEWKAAKGDWKVVDGVLSGTELAADDHGAVMKRAIPVKDVIIEYDVMLGATKGTSFSIDDANDHVCRVSISTTGFIAQKDDNDHEGADVAKPFNRVSVELDADEWHTVRIETLGEEMLAQIGDDVSLGS
jgi:hypothetical protein